MCGQWGLGSKRRILRVPKTFLTESGPTQSFRFQFPAAFRDGKFDSKNVFKKILWLSGSYVDCGCRYVLTWRFMYFFSWEQAENKSCVIQTQKCCVSIVSPRPHQIYRASPPVQYFHWLFLSSLDLFLKARDIRTPSLPRLAFGEK